MYSVLAPSSLISRFPTLSSTHNQPKPQLIFKGCSYRKPSFSISFPSNSHYSCRVRDSSTDVSLPSEEGPVSAISIEDFDEKDWSFLDPDESSSEEERNQKIRRVISCGRIEETSRVLVSVGCEEFVDQLMDTSPCNLLLVVHDSLFLLACIKEKYDDVKCWQGELVYVPDKWSPFNVVFLYFLPALPLELDQVFSALGQRCSPGARVVISHLKGREVLEQQRKQYPDVVVSSLPDQETLKKVAGNHSFEIAEFTDDSGFYLAVLHFPPRE